MKTTKKREISVVNNILVLLAKIATPTAGAFIVGAIMDGVWCGIALSLIALWLSYSYFTSDKYMRERRLTWLNNYSSTS